jgi:2-dehydropantoate 2-reductase
VRFVIFGAGAIGGVVGARLHQAGHNVHLIARGAHHDAIAARGLTLETPQERVTLSLPVSATLAEATLAEAKLRAEDVVLLAVKSQDTSDALAAIREATEDGPAPPIVCLQNGVENERAALRLFPDVYGAVVMSPTAHLEPGTVQAYATKITGAIDIGRYPRGTDERCNAICAALAQSRFDSEPRADIVRHKYAKLIANLGNAVEAVCGTGAPRSEELAELAAEEGRAVLRGAGIEFEVDAVADVSGRWARWGVGEIGGRPRGGGSTWQSVMRGTGRVETDLLNGEIVLQARLIGLAAPVNERLQALALQTLRTGRRPGWRSAGEILSELCG